jgi:hypothetical protein
VVDAYSSITEKRLPGSATISSRQKSEPPSTELTIRTSSGCSSTTSFGTCTSRPCSHIAALWAANFSLEPTSSPRRGWSASGSNRIPSGARSISRPPSETRTTPAASSSSNAGAAATSAAPFAENVSGSKPFRSVKRQDSSVVVGSGSAR